MRLARREIPTLRAGLLAAAALGVFPAARAEASESTKQCLGAYEAGQRLRQAGDLITAAGELRVCGGPACPVRMQGDCQRWLDDVERSTPTVIFRVRDAHGEQLANVTVSIDGAAAKRLDGRALLMNPGEHRIVFEHPGFQSLETPAFVTEGEKLEPREVTLEPLVSLDPADHLLPQDAVPGMSDAERVPAAGGSSISAWPLALGAVGVLGGAGFVYFGVRAKSGETDLEQCSPDCTQASVDGVKRDYLWSNVSLGVGLAGLLGAGLWLVLDEPSGQASATPRHAVRVGSTTTWVTRF
ncbi:MAG TPA: hypothetical protein VMG12_09855 [Polyangiaceae bacterium]|nr:hypothetical protein [Polyangiaceae bacterium]